ncbi:hypothetical protein ACLB6G_13370 [Zhengella sp. ZM62]|uniref:hypothetical protein n=1 Tax=Zhengella sedimenti TaxID=3390035 RepID=UPI00397524DD
MDATINTGSDVNCLSIWMISISHRRRQPSKQGAWYPQYSVTFFPMDPHAPFAEGSVSLASRTFRSFSVLARRARASVSMMDRAVRSVISAFVSDLDIIGLNEVRSVVLSVISAPLPLLEHAKAGRLPGPSLSTIGASTSVVTGRELWLRLP